MRAALRLFFAVPLPQAPAAALDPALRALPVGGWRVVAPQHRHVTLRFLGDQPEQVVGPVLSAARSACAGLPAFSVEVAGLGAFPTLGRPEVLWAGCRRGAEDLCALAADLESALTAAGLAGADRRFRPHVTLARRRQGEAPRAAAAAVAGLVGAHGGRVWGEMAVRAVTLFRSDLGMAGPRYTPLGEASLAADPAPRIP